MWLSIEDIYTRIYNSFILMLFQNYIWFIKHPDTYFEILNKNGSRSQVENEFFESTREHKRKFLYLKITFHVTVFLQIYLKDYRIKN